ncbi:17-beta-hydroxysteroid dehydrogenase type 6 [Halotydeus destructor]|nr:17-beta-hydroxysteroid dehydrogenase type 6 [Halotydeus destructor]
MFTVENAFTFLHLSSVRLHVYAILVFVSIVIGTSIISLVSPIIYTGILTISFIGAIGWLSVRVASVFGRLVRTQADVQASNKAVLITGSASGFGFKLAQQLDQLGFSVFAACRAIDDERALNLQKCCSERLTLVKLDVTSDDQVTEAVHFVKSRLGDKYLWAVVNNAGIFALEGVDWGKSGVHEYQRLMNTNALGAVRVSRAFLPLLKKCKHSRVIMTASIAGRIEWPGMAAYAMSKFALRAFANALRRELRPFDVYVSVIEPTFYSTPLVDETQLLQALNDKWNFSPDAVKETYTLDQVNCLKDSVKTLLDMTHDDQSPVIESMVKSVNCSTEPEHFYRVCSHAESVGFYALESLPTEIIDHNLLGLPLTIACKAIKFATVVETYVEDILGKMICSVRQSFKNE